MTEPPADAFPPLPDAPPPKRGRRWGVAAAGLALAALAAWSIATGVTARNAFADIDAHVAEIEAHLAEIAPLSDAEIAALRRSRNAEHIAAAQAAGIEPVATRAGIDSAVVRDGLVRLPATPRRVVLDGEHSDPVVIPETAAALDSLDARFADSLRTRDLPVFFYTVSSLLRSDEDQRELRGVNSNASPIRSSHEYGTTLDITYRRFGYDPAAPAPTPPRPRRFWPEAVREGFARRVDRARAEAFDDLAETHADELAALLGRTLIAMENDAILLALREVRQPVYHITAPVEAP